MPSQYGGADDCRDHGDLIGDAEGASEVVAGANGNSDQMDTEDSMQETDEIERGELTEGQPQVRYIITDM